jgi:D-alanyl-D-alanine carboxypeptidase
VPLRFLALLVALLLTACASSGTAPSFSVPTLAAAEARAQSDPRYAGIVVDTASGAVLYAEDADSRRHPASLTKLMTLYILFSDIEAGRFAMSSQLSVSANAARMPASKLGLKRGQTIAVKDAILAITVRSANDVAVVVAEAISGSEAAFVERMNREARTLGLSATRFRNSTGLPDARQVTSARDIATLARAIQVRFPNRYSNFGVRSFTYKGRKLTSTNQLLGAIPGVDGMKTGYIRMSGYNLVASAKRGNDRIIVVVMGEKSGTARNGHVAALIEEFLPEGNGLFAAR